MKAAEPLVSIARRFWPQLETLEERERRAGAGHVLGVLYATPLALVGLVWLAAATDWALVRAEWPTLLLLGLLLGVFERFSFSFFVEVAPGAFADWQGSLESLIAWSAALILGPSAWWLGIPWTIRSYLLWWHRSSTAASRWSCARDCAFSLASLLARLIALRCYERWGGVYPLSGLTPEHVLPAFGAILVGLLLSTLVWAPYVLYHTCTRAIGGGSLSASLRFWQGTAVASVFSTPFSVLAAGLYAQNGLAGYLFALAGVLLASVLAHRLSRAAERSQQRSRELEKLEQLGRAILVCCPDASDLADVLAEHVATMFPYSSIEIRIYPDRTLMHHSTAGVQLPPDRQAVPEPAWAWLRAEPTARCFLPGKTLPWDPAAGPIRHAVIVAPILDLDNLALLGGIYVASGWRPESAAGLLPAVQSLAAQIASALHSAEVYKQTLAHQKVAQELALAGRVQASFLPVDLPDLLGWQLAAALESARETSGDFYDLFSLPGGRLGILIADVADKGLGAALYMAKCSTLIRTYAAQFETQPARVLGAANRRILADTRADLFVTAFYGVLDPSSGALTYCNAGHNPPVLCRGRDGRMPDALRRTGMALGVVEGETWGEETVCAAPGDLLLLYTDGVTDAQNAEGAFFGEERLLAAVRAHPGEPAAALLEAVLGAVHDFVGDAAQFDDITLVVVARQ